MKTLLLIVTSLMFVSCSSVKDTTNAALDQARSGASVGFNTERVPGGYQVSGNASTNVFGVEPYGSFKAGIRYAPRQAVEPVVVTQSTK